VGQHGHDRLLVPIRLRQFAHPLQQLSLWALAETGQHHAAQDAGRGQVDLPDSAMAIHSSPLFIMRRHDGSMTKLS
jgi:hypothetical protein